MRYSGTDSPILSDEENVRDHYIDCLIEWGEYKKAIEVIDDNKDDFRSYSKKWEDRLNNHNYLYGVLDRLGYIVVAPEYQSLDFLNAHTLVGRKPHSDSESINL